MTTPTAKLLERLAREAVKNADLNATSAIVLQIKNATPGRTRSITEVLRSGDVYRALTNAADKITADANAIAVITCGWAAPVENDDTDNTPPSLHPNRQRVCLVVTHHLDTRETVSAIKFAAKRNVITDHGNAHGSLADAVQQLGDAVAKARA